jgi:isoleucyl-tRNA synthetase
MKSTILQIIVKEWFKDRLGGELEDVVIDAIIKELTEKKDNRITITDIEPKSSPIHYESKKDAEANKETRSIKKQINDLLFLMESGKNCIGETSNQLKDLFDNREPKEEEQTFITETQTMFIVEVKMLSSEKKIYHVLNSKNKEEAVSKAREHYKLEAKLNGRCYVIDIIDYEFIN